MQDKKKKYKRKKAKKKSIALKAQEEKVVDETKFNNIKDDIALITKRVKKLMMNNKYGGNTYNKRSSYKKEDPSKEEKENRKGEKEVIFYKCKKPGHVKHDRPLYKAKRKKRRAMMTTWSQSENSFDDENENEVANMCFMDFENKDEVNSNFDENEEFMFE